MPRSDRANEADDERALELIAAPDLCPRHVGRVPLGVHAIRVHEHAIRPGAARDRFLHQRTGDDDHKVRGGHVEPLDPFGEALQLERAIIPIALHPGQRAVVLAYVRHAVLRTQRGTHIVEQAVTVVYEVGAPLRPATARFVEQLIVVVEPDELGKIACAAVPWTGEMEMLVLRHIDELVGAYDLHCQSIIAEAPYNSGEVTDRPAGHDTEYMVRTQEQRALAGRCRTSRRHGALQTRDTTPVA